MGGPSRLQNLSPKMQSGNFSTLVENFPLSKSCQKKYFLQNCMNWNILQRSKIFHFWWKTFHFGDILFSAFKPSRLPNFIPNEKNWNFFHFGGKFSPLKNLKKKKKKKKKK